MGGSLVHREVRETVRDLKAKLDAQVEENELMRDAFAEANYRTKCLFWALHPSCMHTGFVAAGASPFLSLKRRTAVAGSWHPALDRLALRQSDRVSSPPRTAAESETTSQ